MTAVSVTSAEPRAPATGPGQTPLSAPPVAGRGRRAPSVAASAPSSGAGRGRGSTASAKLSRSRLELVPSVPSPRATTPAGGSGGLRAKPSARAVHILSDMDDEECDADGDVDFYS